MRISSSCRPSLFFSGQFLSLSLDTIVRFRSPIYVQVKSGVLHYLAALDYALDLGDERVANTHYP
jgi:hypothetical protein